MSYGGDINRGPFLDTIDWVFASIALVVVALRLISPRALERANWEIDDAFIALAMAVVLVRAIHISICISMGFGQHLDVLLEEDPVATVKLTRLLVILQAISLWTWTLPKLPVARLLVRLFGKARRHVGIVLYSLVGFLIVWVIILTIVTFVKCSPIDKNWNPTVEGECWNPHIYLGLGYFAGAYSAALDIGFAIYPAVRISSLQMTRSKKILISASLGLGIPAGITTIYKLTTIATLVEAGDPTWATIPLEVWNSVESCALIFAAGIPMSQPLLMLIGGNIKAYVSRLSSSMSLSTSGESKLRSGIGGASGSKLYNDEETSKYSQGMKFAVPQMETRESDDVLLSNTPANP